MDAHAFDQLFRLDDRVAIVTGGSRGIGRSIALGYARAGAKVVVASRKRDACDRVVEEIEAIGGEALAVGTHMGDLAQGAALVAATRERFGRIDILVNNAALTLAQPFGQMTSEAFEKSIAVNLRGPVFLIQEALEDLKTSPHASVINVSSAAAYQFSAYIHMYAAGKAGLLAYTRALAAELAPHGIRVNAIAPGLFDTDGTQNMPDDQEQSAMASLMARFAHPDEMVALALFLASDAGSFMTGSTVNIDGGLIPR
ncbi:MAG: SDR family NAD(P)-dependent oxidoreductase [Phycisphaerales bacterium JB058]